MKTYLFALVLSCLPLACAAENPSQPGEEAAPDVELAAHSKIIPPVLTGSAVTYVKEARAKALSGDAEGASNILGELLSLTGNAGE